MGVKDFGSISFSVTNLDLCACMHRIIRVDYKTFWQGRVIRHECPRENLRGFAPPTLVYGLWPSPVIGSVGLRKMTPCGSK